MTPWYVASVSFAGICSILLFFLTIVNEVLSMPPTQLAKDVKKHVAAIRISNDIGLMARKMWNILLLNAYDALLTRQQHVINLSVLSEAMGSNSRNYVRLRESLEKLATTAVTWDVGGAASSAGQWNKNFSVSSLLAWGKVDDGVLYYGFSPILAELLYNPEIYQRINIAQQRLFKTSYGLALWENCMRYCNTGSTGMLAVEDWRKLLGATAKTYDEYRRFSQKVLMPAIREVNAVSNIELQLKIKRTDRRVTQLGFLVTRKEASPVPTPEAPGAIADSGEFRQLVQHGITDVQAKFWIQEHGYDYVREKLALLEEKLLNRSITSSVSGFLAAAIRNDFKSEKLIQKVSEDAARKKQQVEEKERKIKKLREELARNFAQQAKKDFLLGLSEQAHQQLLQEIMAEKQDDLFIREELLRLGLDSPFVGLEVIRRIPDYKRRCDKFVKNALKEQGLVD
ncbi:replication initiation protein [Thiothrix subterranea]|uniref:Replication initiation protein n=1 Tax=Thiothrix subterranea TaxID=2735563 RepID=A0AA51MLZ7_9GAMM|nr:replication initiation protein [Thiothrix subterranea]MDQ5768644.1 replication initiation protein [Thiothrix subterranea]WML84797.1 replication initiation protein [Thiothrix subterranea]